MATEYLRLDLRVLLIAPNVDGTDVGEAYVAFKWAEALSASVDLTLLSFERPGRKPLREQLSCAEVVTWPEPAIARLHERFNAMAKPAYPVFSRKVRGWLKEADSAGRCFEVAHQLMPQAARYSSPLRHFRTPYVIGPLGGALSTPEAFREGAESAPMFTRLRELDRWRFRNDPMLRKSYENAALVLGVAPYVRDILGDIPLRRFEPLLELGIDELAPDIVRPVEPGKLKLLHVGRGVRTKGLRDVIYALSIMKDLPGVTLTSAGAGEEIEQCKALAESLGISHRVSFRGRVPREDVEQLYETHDVFCFPSFREPAGGVLYEAMRWGLPVVTAARGGPNWIIDDSCGIRLHVRTPEQLASDIAKAATLLCRDSKLRQRLGKGARDKVEREGLWQHKAETLTRLYSSIACSNGVSACPKG